MQGLSLPFLGVQLFSGLTLGMFVFLIAAGLSLVFGVLGIVNFAHGTLYMLGAYLAFSVATMLGQTGLGFWASLIVAPLIVAAIGVVVEVFLLRRIYRQNEALQILLTYSLVLIFDDVVKMVWGTDYKAPNRPAVLDQSVSFFGAPFPAYNVFVLLVGIAVMASLWCLLYRTRFGRVVRAAAEDREMTSILGIDARKLYTVVFALGAFLGGLGGTLAGPVRTVFPGAGTEVIIEAFIVVVIGGLGSFAGALVGSLLLGEFTAIGIMLFPRFQMAFPFLLMAGVLVFRPTGLFGRATR